jgi:hypothetical protein
VTRQSNTKLAVSQSVSSEAKLPTGGYPNTWLAVSQ